MKLLTLLFFILSVTGLYAQVDRDTDVPVPVDSGSQHPTEDHAQVFVEEMPEFPGGQESMYKFIAQNMKYPQYAVESNIQGKVYVRFIVEADGRITNVNVVRGVHSSLDNEAIRVVQSMPDWKPGKQNGKPVRVHFTLPLNFSLK